MLGLVVIAAVSGTTVASYVSPVFDGAAFTAKTLTAISPSLSMSATSASASWSPYSGTLAKNYNLSHATDASGSNAALIYSGANTTASDSGGFVAPSSVSARAGQVEAGYQHACAIENAAVYCWGDNSSGQVNGTAGSPSTVTTPTLVALPGTPSAVSAGTSHTCAISSGNLYCWGSNSSGQLGGSSTSTPVGGSLAGQTVTAVSAGKNFTCAIATGTGYCWGDGTNGKLGIGSTTSQSSPQAISLPAGNVTAIAAGSGNATGDGDSACAVSAGYVYCWGYNSNGQVGDGSATTRTSPVPVSASALSGTTAFSVSVGDRTACATTDGGVYCWGSGTNGELGNSASSDSSSPVAVTGSSSWSAISLQTGGHHSCVVTSAQVLKCWGRNTSGELGNNSTSNSNSPVNVNTSGVLSGVSPRQVAAGAQFSCAVGGGGLYCWGANGTSQLLDGTTATRLVPVASTLATVTGCPNGASLMAGNSCSLAPSTSYWWQLGYTYGTWQAPNSAWVQGTTTARPASSPSASSVTSNTTTLSWPAITPSSLQTGRYVLERATDTSGSNLSTVSDNFTLSATDSGNLAASSGVPAFSTVSTGYGTSCGIANGKAYCWGYNAYGQVGDGTTTERHTPVPVVGLGGMTVTDIAVSGTNNATATTCAIANAKVYCWGYNGQGEVGDGTTTNRSVPTPVQGISGSATDIDAGDHHVCAVAGAQAYCWGANSYGELGNGTNTTSALTAFHITGLSNVTHIAPGYIDTCAIAGGAAYCWGYNADGQLGNGTTGGSTNTPTTAVSGGSLPAASTIIGLDSGTYFSCAIASDHNAYCWGYGATGRLGNGAVASASRPVAVTQGLTGSGNVTSISAGMANACVIASGWPYCWGYNLYGQLGNNATADTSSPVKVVSSSTAGTLPPGSTSTAIASGFATTCLVASGSGYCWGYGGSGAFGNNSTANSNDPVAVLMPTVSYCPAGSVAIASGCSLAANTTYYYRIRYYLGSWAGPTSGWVAVTTSS